MEKQFRIAILYICTGEYVVFWEAFYNSFEKYFLKKSSIEYFVFTDSPHIFGEEENNKIHKIYQKNLGWPGNTLFRFRMFNMIRGELGSFDFVFFLNANIVCMEEIKEEEFLPLETELLLVQHPGYYKTHIRKLPYERRRESSACIPRGKGRDYVYGAINGGRTEAFLRMTTELDKDIQKDFKKGIIAKWHDESHLNCYAWRYGNYRLLTPEYAYPEGWELPYKEKIRILDKKLKIKLDPEKIKELENRSMRKRLKRLFTKMPG